MKKSMHLLPAMVTAVILSACSGPQAIARSTEPSDVIQDVVYLNTPQRALHLDLYLNPQAHKKPVPILVYFHGGAWARGAPPESWTGFRAYLDKGFSVATVEYRLAGEALAPAAVQDARCAVHWIASNAQKLGVDKDRIVLIGTSAGGHLALMAGMLPPGNDVDTPDCSDAPQPAAIIDLYGPNKLDDLHGRSGGRHPSVMRWTGAGAAGEVMEERMSPVTYLRENTPPIFIGHGDADPVVPVEQSIAFKQALDEANVTSDLFIVPGGGHGRFPKEEEAKMKERIFRFLEEVGVLVPDASGG